MGFQKHRFLTGLFAAALIWPGLIPANAGSFKVQQQWKIGGEGGWQQMAVDSERHRLYVPRTERITVVDTQTGKPLGEVTGFQGIRSMCFDASGKFGYVTDGPAGALRMFDRSTLKIVASVPVGVFPEAVLFEPVTQSVFVFNYKSKSVSVVDAACSRLVNTIALDGRPGGAATDGKGVIYVNIADAGAVAKISATTGQIEAMWPLPGCVGPSGMTIDTTRGRIFSVCENGRLIATTVATGKTAASAAIADGSAVVFDSGLRDILVASSDGTLSVLREVSPTRYSTAETVKTLPGARTLALDSLTQHVFLSTAQFGLRTGPDVSEELRFRPTPVPGSFVVLVVGRASARGSAGLP